MNFPKKLSLDLWEGFSLRYGENPHQDAAIYILEDRQEDTISLTNLKLYSERKLSYNNLLDIDSAIRIVKEFDKPAATIIKHNNPCGVAIADDIYEAFKKAFEADPKSAFGGIIGLNREVNNKVAEEIANHFFEVIVAPKYSESALDILKKKKKLIIAELDLSKPLPNISIRSVCGLFLVQIEKEEEIKLDVVTEAKPDDKTLRDLIFAWKVVKHVKSNAIVVAKHGQTLGIGAGQMSRVDAVEIALKKAGEKAKGAVLASDAFFPFRDSIDLAAEYGIKAIIQPGGSIRDKEVIEACNEHGIVMIFTHVRVFRH